MPGNPYESVPLCPKYTHGLHINIAHKLEYPSINNPIVLDMRMPGYTWYTQLAAYPGIPTKVYHTLTQKTNTACILTSHPNGFVCRLRDTVVPAIPCQTHASRKSNGNPVSPWVKTTAQNVFFVFILRRIGNDKA